MVKHAEFTEEDQQQMEDGGGNMRADKERSGASIPSLCGLDPED